MLPMRQRIWRRRLSPPRVTWAHTMVSATRRAIVHSWYSYAGTFYSAVVLNTGDAADRVGGCDSDPGPADDTLYCAQTTSPSWLAYKWYKFVDQPAMKRAKLSSTESQYLQGRVEKLHEMLNAGGEAASKWIKERGTSETLATVDKAQLVTPPEGFEKGFVPV